MGDEEFFKVHSVSVARLNLEDSNNVENHLNRVKNFRGRGSTQDQSRNNRSVSTNRDHNKRNSNRADRDRSCNSLKEANHSWRNRGARASHSSSRPRTSSNQREGTNWRENRNVSNSNEFAVFNQNRKPGHGNRDSRTERRFDRDHRTESGFGRFDAPNKRDDRNESGYSGGLDPDRPIRHNNRNENHHSDGPGPDRPNRRNDRNETNRPEKRNREIFIGYKYLKALSEKEPHEMICDILNPKADINFVLNRPELQPDWIMLIMETVRKLCESDFKSNRAQVLQYFCESKLLDHISRYLGEVGMEKNKNTIKNLDSFVSDLVLFFATVITTIPTVAVDKNFDKFLFRTKNGIDQMKIYLHKEIDKTIEEKLVNLEKILQDETDMREKKIEKPRRRYEDVVDDFPPPEDFRELSLYPTEEDLNRCEFGFVRPNKIKGAYEDVDHYLDVQFRLIREDFIDPLRRGLRNYKDAVALSGKPKYKYESVRLYPNARIENIEVTKQNQVAYVVNFNVNGKLKIKWEYSKRFMFGSLLIFTRDHFDSFFFASVFNRDLEKLKKGRILVSLIGIEELKPEMFDRPFVMAESEVYFEPYHLVMKALKEYNESDFPMKKFIVDGNTEVDLPQYIINLENFYIYNYLVDVRMNDGWPHYSYIGFDEHQFNAFKTALTSSFTVIQGPPGTGKTYLGLKIVEVLLNNINMNPTAFKTPILLVCYTNHALDQFLEGILKFTRKIVRVGGQSKSEQLKPYNLRGQQNLTNLRREARRLIPTMDHCRNEMRRLLFQLKKKTEEKNKIENPEGILSHYTLSDVMSEEFKCQIKDDGALFLWLTEVKNAPFVASNNPERNIARNIDASSSEPVEMDDEIYIDEDGETMEADILINEDDVFDTQEVNPNDMSVNYWVTLQSLEVLYMKTLQSLEDLERNESEFDDYAEYYNLTYLLQEKLYTVKHQYDTLNHYIQEPDLNSSVKYHVRGLNLWEFPMDLRWKIYWTLVSQLKQIFVKELKKLEADYRSRSQQYEELKQMEDFHIVKNSLVVGMTTTCAARLQLLLKTLSPAIVIVEEAAEVLEAHIVVSLSKKCEHVILIGDHKQLKPSTAVYELSKRYNINVSLFERMINNNMYCPQLQIQHRMRPEISSLIVPSIYPNLKNHDSVLKYSSVKGITKNLFFVEHNVHEENVDDSSSRKNRFEGEFMIQLCRYLLLQGYTADQITILTTYTGQMFLLREMKRDYSIMRDVKTIVVDKYQGEENDIILLSLVRSNKERKIGFLSIENRVCVALSRAKIGLYIIGNMDILSDSKLWKNIKEELVTQEAIGSKLPLYCEKHDVYTEVSCRSDFNNVLEGGCNNFCHEMLDCGHKCQLLCHKIDMEHSEKKCREKCLKRCVENHPCTRYCFENCGQCIEVVERILPCGHTARLLCYVDYQNYPCREEISVVLEHCSHEVKKKCFEPMDSVNCTFPCEDRLDCGHQCVKNCHKTKDPDHLEYKCHKPCEKINRECTQEHKCEKLCFEDCGKCKVRVDFMLKCDHPINLQCSANLDRVKCHNPCERKCSDCKARCRKKCFEDCKPCMNIVTKIIPDCGHKKKIECSIAPERNMCREKCQRLAPCGHACKSVCGEICGTGRCEKIVKSTRVQALCGHGYADVPCWKKNEAINAEDVLQYCSEPCNELLKCEDPCSGTCGSCWQGRLHQDCHKECGNVLVCGHSCSSPCRKLCPSCTKKCQYSCKHSKCPKNCGVPCVTCKENCEWQCRHFKCTKKCGDMCNRLPCYEPCPEKLPCNHDCIGFCGEPCPQKCRICDEDEVKMILFGDEDEDDARFVLLEDCGHFIESKAMDKYIDMPAERGEIVKKCCPLCKTPISKTLRYMNQVKKVYRDIQNVKRKIYGNEKETNEIRSNLIGKLDNLNLRNQELYREEFKPILKTVISYKQKLRARGKQSHLPKEVLRAMNFFVDVFTSIISRLDDLRKCADSEKSRILKRLEFILKRVDSKALVINLQKIDEIQKELNRYHRFVDYGMFIRKPEYLNSRELPVVIRINTNIGNILFGLKCYDDQQDKRIDELFEQLQKESKSCQTISPEEKRMIHQAMAKDFYGGVNSQGHWFTCTKGHYYCITECGGAMQESKCPECGEKIGGSDHRYVSTVRVASDMDGATRPAWSTGGDIRNFQF